MPQTEEFVATGRRKTSVARIRMTPGSGKIEINGRTFEDYFPTAPLQNVVLQPLQSAKAVNAYDLWINTSGGGSMGQAGAAQLAIARALLQVDANLRGPLKAEGLLRRDPRMKERKKSGQPGAISASRIRISFGKRILVWRREDLLALRGGSKLPQWLKDESFNCNSLLQ